MDQLAAIAARFKTLAPHLDEKGRRLLAASEAEVLGRGGVAAVSRTVGMVRQAIVRGLRELKEPPDKESGSTRIRKPGGGRKKSTETDPDLLRDLESLIEPVTRGDPESPLRWSSKSTYKLADAMKAMGHKISASSVGRYLRELKYSLQANSKVLEGSDHIDRDAQFEHINSKATEQISKGNPVISVDTKKRELIGEFKNGGRELRPQGQPEKVRVHDFEDDEHAIPYGVYDVKNNEGWVSVGIDKDTSTFAVETIRRWWYTMGKPLYPHAEHLLITADGGGSNGSRVRLFKLELQNLVDELGFPISVSHLPPGTSKWNKIEHRLFSQITQNWRGKPLLSYAVIVNLIRGTRNKSGIKVRCELDTNKYPTGRRFSKESVDELNLVRDEFHGEWNYTIYPSYLAPD